MHKHTVAIVFPENLVDGHSLGLIMTIGWWCAGVSFVRGGIRGPVHVRLCVLGRS